jgi:histidine triad (HIT) family protein
VASIFSKIVEGKIPCYKIAENEHCFAFLDIFPLKEGHVLVIPKVEVDHIFDLDLNEYEQLHSFAYKVAQAIRNTISSERICVVVAGFEVPHAHIHLIPADNMEDINFNNPKLQMEPSRFEELAKMISDSFSQIDLS